MQGEQPDAEDFLLVDEMADVRAREPRAGRAGTIRLQWALIARKPRVAQVEAPLARQRGSGARRSRREHAVEHVHAALDHLEDALRIADAHEIARLAFGEEVATEAGQLEHLLPALADREPADSDAVEVERRDLLD